MLRGKKNSHYKILKKKWEGKHKDLQENLWDKHKRYLDKAFIEPKKLATGSIASMILLSQPAVVPIVADTIVSKEKPVQEIPAQTNETLIKELTALLPKNVEPLSDEQERGVSKILHEYFNISVSPDYDGKRLNRTYGLIGAEQHLMRYPGDTMATHFTNPEDRKQYYSSGMAPGRGAWGYFASSRAEMTQADIDREKYYVAVQTFLAPDWKKDVKEHYEFFKYRKMIVVNPENGKAVVAIIGDAGPAEWTGKHLGGSPEVMDYLERQDGTAKGPVLYFFTNDPHDNLPLGPINVQ